MQPDHEEAAGPAEARYAKIRVFLQDVGELVSRARPTPETVQGVKNRLSALIKEAPELPAQVRKPSSEHYARHLLYQEPQGRYEVVVMAWSPGQATPIHDHAGIWCVEGVVEGVVDVTRYDLKEMLGGNAARMERTEVIHAGLGQCGALIPPVEYHRISNPYDGLAITLHVYGGRMQTCRVFLERGDGSYEVSQKELGFTTPKPALSSLAS